MEMTPGLRRDPQPDLDAVGQRLDSRVVEFPMPVGLPVAIRLVGRIARSVPEGDSPIFAARKSGQSPSCSVTTPKACAAWISMLTWY